MSTLYDELGITPQATDEEILAAYRKLARQFHPDRNPGCEAQAKERFQRIQKAFDVLSNPAKRAKYDETLGPARFAAGPLSVATPVPEIKIDTGPRQKQKRHKPLVAFLFAAAAAVVMMVVGLILFRQGDGDKRLAARVSQKSPPNKTPWRSDAAPSEQGRRTPSRKVPRSQKVSSPAPGYGDESATSGNRDAAHEAEFVKTVPDEQSMVDERTPSEADRLLTDNLQQGADAPNDPQMQPNSQLNELIGALDAGDKAKVSAAVKSLRAADAFPDGVRPIVDRLMRVDEGYPYTVRVERVGFGSSYVKALWILSEAGTDTDWILELLLKMQSGFTEYEESFQSASDPISYWYSMRYETNPAIVIPNAEARHEITRLLAEFHAKDQHVVQLFAKRLEQLRSAPQPYDRAIAALWLSRSMALSDTTIPALLESVKRDSSIDVKRAALLSLAGFRDPSKPVIAVVDKGIEYFKDDHEMQFILFASLASVDCKSAQFKRGVGDCLLAYKSGKGNKPPNLVPVCQVLEFLQTRASWAVPQLVNAAEVAIVRDGADFQMLSNALLGVGVNDDRALKFYERAAKEGPQNMRVYCDSIAKELKLRGKP